MSRTSYFLLLLVSLFAAAEQLGAQATAAGAGGPIEGRVRVYLDCQRCDTSFIQTEVNFVDYVRDRMDSDVHLLVTTQPTGAGGTEYAMQFIGLGRFNGVSEELRYASVVTDSQDQVRRGMVRIMSAGLVPFIARTTMASQMQLSFRPVQGAAASSATAAEEVRDPWNRWVFRTSLSGSMMDEASYHSLNMNASFSASQITDAWKTTFSVFSRNSNSKTKVRDNWVTNKQEDYSANTLMVKSINDHWSIGGRTNANHSTFQNRDLSLRVAPAIEYNVFPYSESTRRQLTIQYSVGGNQVQYLQETIYGRMSQTLMDEALNVSFMTRQTWGSGNVSLEASHYFPDTSRYRLDADAGIDLRIYRGLSLDLSGSAQRIHDQLHLVKGDLSDEQILLRQRQIATNYRYSFSVGLGYSFGSIFSSAVNPRLGTGGGGGAGGAGGAGGGGFSGGGGGGAGGARR